MNDYLVINNAKGSIFVIGDVHGSVDTLKAVLTKLTPKDTLVIAGDLIDRGVTLDTHVETSSDVLNLIINNNEEAIKNKAPYIYSIQGNHEKDFLTIMSFMHSKEEWTPEKMTLLLDMLTVFIGNGGGWIFKKILVSEKISNQIIFQTYSSSTTEKREKLMPLLKNILNLTLQDSGGLIPNIGIYIQFIKDLPYIIKINDTFNPAWVVHSDLPFNDTELNNKILHHHALNDMEIQHLLYTRENGFSKERTDTSDCVYCGHNPIEDTQTGAVRKETNHINLDSAAYVNAATLLVNHTTRAVDVVSANPQIEANLNLLSARDKIKEHLDNIHNQNQITHNTTAVFKERAATGKRKQNSEDTTESSPKRAPPSNG